MIANVVIASAGLLAGFGALAWLSHRPGFWAWGGAEGISDLRAIPLLMLVPDPGAAWVSAIMLSVVGITIASGLDYALTYEREATAADASGAVPVARW